MKLDERLIRGEERAVFALRSLYKGYGYTHFKMSKFEEYDLYVRNKDFLVSGEVITFTDKRGKLLALKPDVTLSIIKNSRDVPGCVQKLYYNENVYRVVKGGPFREIMQTGLECIGDIGRYEVCETLTLALKSLEAISPDFVLDVSHMGVVSAAMELTGAAPEIKERLLACLGRKNAGEIERICRENDLSPAGAELIRTLASSYGAASEVLSRLRALDTGAMSDALDELEELCGVLAGGGWGDRINLDFSIINDMSYYSGVVFRGYVKGIPDGVLAGGQYDSLMRRMGRSSGAIGFAVYLDQLERLENSQEGFDAEVLLLYDDSVSAAEVTAAVNGFIAGGHTVLASRSVPAGVRCARMCRITPKGVERFEGAC